MMLSIASLFDFCVSGEDDDVFPGRKLDERICGAAIGRYRLIIEMQRGEGVGGAEGGGGMVDGGNLNWVHVGDDLADDVKEGLIGSN